VVTSYNIPDYIEHSVAYYLDNTTYTRQNIAGGGSSSDTMPGFYSGLTIALGFPDDWSAITLPYLAIEMGDVNITAETINTSFDSTAPGYTEESYEITIWGFVGGSTYAGRPDYAANRLQRKRLIADLMALLDDQAIDIRDDNSTPPVSLGDGEPTNVTAETIPPSTGMVADQNRFRVNFTLLVSRFSE
jgi:hypothetical protein